MEFFERHRDRYLDLTQIGGSLSSRSQPELPKLTLHSLPNLAYPRYITGEHAAPPEGYGGIPGFYVPARNLGDPNHPDHQDVKD